MKIKSMFYNHRPALLIVLTGAAITLWRHETPHMHYLFSIFFSFLIYLNLNRAEGKIADRLAQMVTLDLWYKANIPANEKTEFVEPQPMALSFLNYYLDEKSKENVFSNRFSLIMDLMITVIKGLNVGLYLAAIIGIAMYAQWGMHYILWGFILTRALLVPVYLLGCICCKLVCGRYPGEARKVRGMVKIIGLK